MKQSKPSILTDIKNVAILILIVCSMMLHSFINATTNSYSSYNALLFGQIHSAGKQITVVQKRFIVQNLPIRKSL